MNDKIDRTDKTDEAILRMVNGLESLYGDTFNPYKTRTLLQEILYRYDINEKCTALATLDDMQEKMFLYLASKKIDGLSNITLKNYGQHLKRFSKFLIA